MISDYIIIGILILILLTPVLVLGFLIYWTIKKRKKIWASVLISLPVVGILLILFWLRLLPGADAYYERKLARELTGISFRINNIDFEYDSPRSFNGDGYSIYVFNLTDEVINQIYCHSLDSYPLHPGYRSHWKLEHWKKTPIQVNERKITNFAGPDGEINKKLRGKEIAALFEKILHEEGNYYAYLYFMHSNDDVGNIDFFLISKKYKKLIIVNHNT